MIARLREKLLQPLSDRHRPGVITVAVAAALFLTLFDNGALWKAIWPIVTPLSLDNLRILATFVIVIFVLFAVLLSLFGIKYVFKPVLMVVLVTAAVVSYFMDAFGVVIDRQMIQNVFETDVREATELLSFGLFWHVLVFGVVPAWLVYRIPVHYETLGREIGKRCLALAVGLLIVAVTVFASYKELALIIRQNRHLRLLVNPNYPIFALATYTKNLVNRGSGDTLKPIAGTVVQTPSWQERKRKRVIVFVLGETARAANFSLNGYVRPTNPELARRDILNFSNVTACATATADSLPCLFSGMQRENFSNSKAKRSENLLDLLVRAGVGVLWRDNNSGSKGVASRVAMEDLTKLKVDGLCRDGECFDEILLRELQPAIDRTPGDIFVVLHQKGSHGPLYYKRVPDAFRKFTPECRQDEVQKCSQEQIVNSYDNTILYTDHFLAETIDFLKGNSDRYDPALIYMSDHGESLGENGIYLHGAPYFMAPAGQTHIPFVVWLSPGFAQQTGIDLAGLKGKVTEPYSHDNLFPSILGLFDIRTEAYRADLDLFAPWRKPPS